MRASRTTYNKAAADKRSSPELLRMWVCVRECTSGWESTGTLPIRTAPPSTRFAGTSVSESPSNSDCACRGILRRKYEDQETCAMAFAWDDTDARLPGTDSTH